MKDIRSFDAWFTRPEVVEAIDELISTHGYYVVSDMDSKDLIKAIKSLIGDTEEVVNQEFYD